MIQDILCVADREGKKVECLGAGIKYPENLGQTSGIIEDLGYVYAIAGRGSSLIAVGYQESSEVRSPRVRLETKLFQNY